MKISFTADVCARAIIAACASYGFDPLSISSGGNLARRGIAPAASAVRIATGAPLKHVCRAMGSSPFTVHHAEKLAAPAYLKAKTAALAAIGGATAVLAPEAGAAKREQRPDPETVSDLPDALLAPRPIAPPIAVEVVDTKTLPPPAAPRLSDRDAAICRLLDAGKTNTEVAEEIGCSVGVVAGVRNRRRLGTLRSGAVQVSAAPAFAPGRGHPADAPRVFGRIEREPQPPPPTRAQIDAADRALIDAAIAAGKVQTVKPDGTSEFVYDPTTRLYTRRPVEAREGGVNGCGAKSKARIKPRKNAPIHDPATAGRGVAS